MENLKEFTERMEVAGPEEWKDIPDIDLYMDQVISYMTRQHIGLDEDETLTSAMINNYIKNGLLPRAKGKRYDREHIGYLTAICLLKQVLTVKETGILMTSEMENKDIETFYNQYRDLVKSTFASVSSSVRSEESKEELVNQAMQMAVSGYAEILACKKILEEIEKEEK